MQVGILGGGQLGRMLALAGYPLGLRFRTLDLSAEAPAGHVSELMADVSPWAFTPDLAVAAKIVTLNMGVFWGAVLTLFWMCQRGQQPVSVMGEELGEKEAPLLAPVPSQET